MVILTTKLSKGKLIGIVAAAVAVLLLIIFLANTRRRSPGRDRRKEAGNAGIPGGVPRLPGLYGLPGAGSGPRRSRSPRSSARSISSTTRSSRPRAMISPNTRAKPSHSMSTWWKTIPKKAAIRSMPRCFCTRTSSSAAICPGAAQTASCARSPRHSRAIRTAAGASPRPAAFV